MISSGDYATMINQAWKNDGFGDYYIYSQDEIDNYYNGTDRNLYPNNNWYDMFRMLYRLRIFIPVLMVELNMSNIMQV